MQQGLKHERQAAFVNSMVGTLIERFNDKLEMTTPEFNPHAAMCTTDDQNLLDAIATVDELEKIAEKANKTFENAIDNFTRVFGVQADAVRAEAFEKYKEKLDDEAHSFEFRVREAIGLVELVSSEKAFEVLNTCRKEIENME